MPSSSTDGPSGVSGSSALTPTTLNVIRLVMLAGSAVFGGIAWYLTSSGAMTPTFDEGAASILRYVFYGLAAAILIGLWLVRQRADLAKTFMHRAPLLIVGYGLAEGLALFGAVYLLLTGNTLLFLSGLLVFLVTFVLLPLQPESDR